MKDLSFEKDENKLYGYTETMKLVNVKGNKTIFLYN